MGSGLILLVIVGAWLAVLVPMALRSHDSAASLKSTDRFSDAMRVLSRRSSREVLVPRRSYESLVVSETRSVRPPRPAARPEPEDVLVPRTAAERRLRTLQVLVGLVLVTLGLTLLGLPGLLLVQLACDLLLVSFVVHLRRQAQLRAQRLRAQARRERRAAPAQRVRRAPRIAGIPDRMPARPAPLTVPLPAPAARYEDRPAVASAAASAATGNDRSWSPVPVPPPTYVGKATAPRRETRVLDLTKPGAWSAALEADDAGLEIFDDGPELDDILSRRRAAGDW